jgi:NTE family protein
MTKNNNKKIGLALGSGGWRGLAHIGVIKGLVNNNIPFEIIAGSSTGSLMGGAYAAVQDIEKLEFILKNIGLTDLINAFKDFRPNEGLFKGERFKKVIENIVGEIDIEDLPITYAATAVDFKTGDLVFLREGSLATAIRASASVPLVFQPNRVDGKRLIDGATRLPIPVPLAKDLGADKVIAVNLYKNVFPVFKGKYSGIQMALKSSHLLLRELARRDCEQADITLYPDIPESKRYNVFSNFLGKADQLIDLGEKVVEDNLKEIKKVIS